MRCKGIEQVFKCDTQDRGDTGWVLSVNCRRSVSSNAVPSYADVYFQFIIYALLLSKNGFALSIHFITTSLENIEYGLRDLSL
jgi:hypothetical protein